MNGVELSWIFFFILLLSLSKHTHFLENKKSFCNLFSNTFRMFAHIIPKKKLSFNIEPNILISTLQKTHTMLPFHQYSIEWSILKIHLNKTKL